MIIREAPVQIKEVTVPTVESKPPGSLLSTDEAAEILCILSSIPSSVVSSEGDCPHSSVAERVPFHPNDLTDYVNSRRNHRKSVFKVHFKVKKVLKGFVDLCKLFVVSALHLILNGFESR
jgi:hypothetical protein